ncbi:MAG: glycosyl hydrolase repeat-containing protein, partial [Gemmatimonadetes bacterium]|nr:glycosyl hydrolase repeat-containing protein [Gemmatimonadota bacterium]
KVDPTNPDIVYTGSILVWKSVDGGRTWASFRGAAGGDDYHRIWIHPTDPKIMLVAGDQGAIITVNGGATWSSWYNQPTAQFYHVSTDNAWPYRVCGGQQESGSVCIASRGDDGQITFREWHPVGVEEYGYVAPDPLDPDIVYGGKVTRYDRRTGQVQNVAPRLFRSQDYRVLRTMPVLFSPADPKTLYFASNVVWQTHDGGTHWTQISPDLTRRDSVVPANVGVYASTEEARRRHPGVIYTLAPSPRSGGWIWAGTDDGLIHLTRDGGKTWRDVTPPDLVPWAKISLIEASPFDTLTAYAAINTFRLDDLRAHIYRTRDGGRSWTPITRGIPDAGVVNAVREDPVRPGLLFAGTEREVYFSLDAGDHWQSLRLNMPATSIRDLVIKDDDLVVGTHGRSFWILDDITPLRQLSPATAASVVVLFVPQRATRVRWNMNTDTPLPPDEPAGENPPDGAIINYWLGEGVSGAVTLEILDSAGALVRRYGSTDEPEKPIPGQNIADFWLRPPQTLSAAPGMHRFLWDLRYPVPPGLDRGYPLAQIVHNTIPEPNGPAVLPGRYTVRLTANGQARTQPLAVRMDPRVKTPPAALARKLAIERQVGEWLAWQSGTLSGLRSRRGEGQPDSAEAALTRLGRELNSLYGVVYEADAAPTAEVERQFTRLERTVGELRSRVKEGRVP